MIQFKRSISLRTWQVVALIVLALLVVVAISYLMFSTGGHIDHLHLVTTLDATSTRGIMNGRP